MKEKHGKTLLDPLKTAQKPDFKYLREWYSTEDGQKAKQLDDLLDYLASKSAKIASFYG